FLPFGGATPAAAVGRCPPMASTALGRFWRGVREPWELLGRMRHERPLWARYWRTVLLQAALALLAGVAVFWVGKQGAEAWNDAFGPEELPGAGAPPGAGGAPGPRAAPAAGEPGTPPRAPGAAPPA